MLDTCRASSARRCRAKCDGPVQSYAARDRCLAGESSRTLHIDVPGQAPNPWHRPSRVQRATSRSRLPHRLHQLPPFRKQQEEGAKPSWPATDPSTKTQQTQEEARIEGGRIGVRVKRGYPYTYDPSITLAMPEA
jgi:hypothetical protein